MNFEDWLSRAFQRNERAISIRRLDLASVVALGRRIRRVHFAVATVGIASALVLAAGVGRMVTSEPADSDPPPATGGVSCTESSSPLPSSGASPQRPSGSVTEPTRETAEEAQEFAARPDNRADQAVLRWIDLVVEGDEEGAWRKLSERVQREIGRESWRSIIEKGGLASVYAPFQEPPNESVHVAHEISSSGEGWLYVVTLATVDNHAAVAIPAFVPMEGDVRIEAPSGEVQFEVPANPGQAIPCDEVFEVSIHGSMPASVEFFIDTGGVRGEASHLTESASDVYTARFAPEEGLEPGRYFVTAVASDQSGVAAEATTFTVEDAETRD